MQNMNQNNAGTFINPLATVEVTSGGDVVVAKFTGPAGRLNVTAYTSEQLNSQLASATAIVTKLGEAIALMTP